MFDVHNNIAHTRTVPNLVVDLFHQREAIRVECHMHKTFIPSQKDRTAKCQGFGHLQFVSSSEGLRACERALPFMVQLHHTQSSLIKISKNSRIREDQSSTCWRWRPIGARSISLAPVSMDGLKICIRIITKYTRILAADNVDELGIVSCLFD